MSAATLASLQEALAEIYDLPATPDIGEFLLTDRANLAGITAARDSDEQLIVAEQGDTLSLALYIDLQVLERLARRDPFAALTQHNLADYLTVAEGVSDRPVAPASRAGWRGRRRRPRSGSRARC